MNHEPDSGQLLADVLAEAAPTGFREAMLSETLRLAGRRRRWRQTRRAAVLLVTLGLLAFLVRQNSPPPLAPTPMAKAKVKSYEQVRTQPLSADAIVVTRPLSADQSVTSVATAEIVRTSTGIFRVINDDELLALVSPRPAALVRLGPDSERLIFANPDDKKGFPVN